LSISWFSLVSFDDGLRADRWNSRIRASKLDTEDQNTVRAASLGTNIVIRFDARRSGTSRV
jgi:hypothetical protein